MATLPKISPDDGFVKVPNRTTTQNTPGPRFPANTPVENPQVTGDAPYSRPSPKP